MKKFPYVKEYSNEPVSGLKVMKEQSSFLMSKMMDIEDIINITFTNSIDDLNDYNNNTNNQTFLKKLFDLKEQYSYDLIKQQCVTLTEDNTKLTEDNNFLTNWIFTLDSNKLLKDYLYHELIVYNKNKSFNDIQKIYPNEDITQLVKNYIDDNIISKYRFKSFKLYTKYYDLKDNIVNSLTNNVLDKDVKLYQKKPVFDIKAIPLNKNQIEVISIKPYVDGIFNITYKQQTSSKLKTFLYYFTVLFEKI